jgi:predicted O-methyltransferase YrrM
VKISGTDSWIINSIQADYPEINKVLSRVSQQVPWTKRQIDNHQGRHPWQSAVLYALARQYNRPGVDILEIGTALGYSAAMMAEASPEAQITTLNPKSVEVPQARKNLKPYRNVTVIQEKSWDYYERTNETYDLVFVDGDHGQVERDLVWWDRVRAGGLFLFHDYSPDGTKRPCQPVYDAVNKFSERTGQLLGVLTVDEQGVGMAGFYKSLGEE